MLSSIFVDIDHFLDYFITQKKIDSIRTIVRSFNSFAIVKKNYFVLHSWELVIIFIIILAFYYNSLLIAIFSGYIFHLGLDQIFNTQMQGKYNCKNYFYFFFYRMACKFDVPQLRKEFKGLI